MPKKYNIEIDDAIGKWGYSMQYVRDELKKTAGKQTFIRISSLGGDLNHGINISDLFSNHGDVFVELHGFCASSATICALGAKHVAMCSNAFYLAHKCSNWIDEWGLMNADEISALIEKLEKNKEDNDKIDLVIANMYAKKTGKPIADIMDILKRGAWMTAVEAKEFGFVDEIIEAEDDVKIDSAVIHKFNAFGFPTPMRDTPENNKSAESLFSEIVTLMKDCFKSKNNTQNLITMNKTFTKINAILGLDGLDEKDGKINVSPDDLSKINQHIETLETEKTEQKTNLEQKDDEIADLKEQIVNLKKSPGDETLEIHADEVDDDKMSVFASAKKMFNQLPD